MLSNRHDWVRPKLQEYYAAIKRLTEPLPANLSAEEFEQYLLRVSHRVAEVADWIGKNLGGSAREDPPDARRRSRSGRRDFPSETATNYRVGPITMLSHRPMGVMRDLQFPSAPKYC
jgi:hypothetical protein